MDKGSTVHHVPIGSPQKGEFKMDQPVATDVNQTFWAPRYLNASLPPAIEGAEWDRLLLRLGLTDAEALAAVREGREVSQPITRFVLEQFRDHFVPEDVLLAVNLQWKAAQEIALMFRSLLGAYRGIDS